MSLLVKHRGLVPLADLLLNFLLLTPLVVLAYHETCHLLDKVLCDHLPRAGPFILFSLGIAAIFLFAYFQNRIPDYVKYYIPAEEDDSDKKKLKRALQHRAYTFALTFVTLAHMKAVTDLFLLATDGSKAGSVKAATAALAVLWAMRGVKNILGPPLTIGLDTDEPHFTDHVFTTYYGVEASESLKSAGDILLTIGMGFSCNHLFWAGITSLQDNVFFPSHFWLSTFTSILVGYGICLAIILNQHRAKKISQRLEEQSFQKKLIFENVYWAIGGVGVITAWRGIWMVLDAAVFSWPVHVLGLNVTCWLGFLGSYIAIAALRLCNSLPYKGFDLDGALPDGEGCLCPNGYLVELLREIDEEEQGAAKKDDTASRDDEPASTPRENGAVEQCSREDTCDEVASDDVEGDDAFKDDAGDEAQDDDVMFSDGTRRRRVELLQEEGEL